MNYESFHFMLTYNNVIMDSVLCVEMNNCFKKQQETEACCEKEKHHKSEIRRCSQIAWQQWGGRPYFPSFCAKMSVKRKQQS